ncbi:DUF2093 domain-containing protein [Sphingomonas bacterium]|uniref:DUF2093 domain-containing protein n=1 Tax=Sphingomonas bacterium TaxID=1895847 RepID=UPI0015767B10|nr:DUF2093 domain-containing protein [Sphingomonas bacterium]
MLMSNTDRPARLHYGPNGFRVLTPGDHVRCAASGARIPLDSLRYWNVRTQEAYASAAIASEAMRPR